MGVTEEGMVPGQLWSFGSVLVEFMARQCMYVCVLSGSCQGRDRRVYFNESSPGIRKLRSFLDRYILQGRCAQRENCYSIVVHSDSGMGNSFLKLGG